MIEILAKTVCENVSWKKLYKLYVSGEAVSTDAIRNCLRVLRQAGVIDMYTENKIRMIRPNEPDQRFLDQVQKFNVQTPLLEKWYKW